MRFFFFLVLGFVLGFVFKFVLEFVFEFALLALDNAFGESSFMVLHVHVPAFELYRHDVREALITYACALRFRGDREAGFDAPKPMIGYNRYSESRKKRKKTSRWSFGGDHLQTAADGRIQHDANDGHEHTQGPEST